MDVHALAELVMGIIGGLGIFLFGMKNMSDGMQAVAGNSLRRMIGAVTNNRLLATAVGVFVTCVVQSSSVTTVMVVGFVNSGVMQLAQAVGVIMGANIGTTITGWILVLKIGKYGLPLLGAAAFVFLFSKGERIRYWAMAIMGVGMVFFGLELMKDACAIIKETPDFEAWFKRFSADNYLGVLQCALVGCVLTMVVQSSSATLGITISLAVQGVITYETAAALVLGENIGTTITALLASLGATTNARRAAYFHAIFNLIGVFWITLIFSWYIDFVQMAVGVDGSVVEMVDGKETYPNSTPLIATTHSVFNIVNTVIFLPFLHVFVKLLLRIVPGKETEDDEKRLTDLDVRMLDTPALAIEQSRNEIGKMGVSCHQMLTWLGELQRQEKPDKEMADKLKGTEQRLDAIRNEIAEFVTHLLSGNVPHAAADDARRQLRMADEYESVSDYISDLDKFDRKLRRSGNRFTDQQLGSLGALHGHLDAYMSDVNDALQQGNASVFEQTRPSTQRIKDEVKQLRRRHLDDLSHGGIAPEVSVAYLGALNAYARVRDHLENIAESISGEN